MTAPEIRAYISRLAPEFRGEAELFAFSVYDGGMTAGYAKLPRSSNPFIPKAAAEKPKGKAR
jgi:hypothetical protein